MANKVYEVILECTDLSGSDAEDLEEVFTLLFEGYYTEGLPSDLKARVIEINEVEDEYF